MPVNPVIRVDSRQLQRVAKRLSELRPELRRNHEAAVLEAAKLIAARARKSASWSRRIPRSIRVIGSGSRVQVAAGNNNTPHARVFDPFDGKPVRHPLWGNRKFWYPQKPRRFLTSAPRLVMGQIDQKVAKGVDDTIGKVKT